MENPGLSVLGVSINGGKRISLVVKTGLQYLQLNPSSKIVSCNLFNYRGLGGIGVQGYMIFQKNSFSFGYNW